LTGRKVSADTTNALAHCRLEQRPWAAQGWFGTQKKALLRVAAMREKVISSQVLRLDEVPVLSGSITPRQATVIIPLHFLAPRCPVGWRRRGMLEPWQIAQHARHRSSCTSRTNNMTRNTLCRVLRRVAIATSTSLLLTKPLRAQKSTSSGQLRVSALGCYYIYLTLPISSQTSRPKQCRWNARFIFTHPRSACRHSQRYSLQTLHHESIESKICWL
jgi:hypothetical protein